MSRLFEIRLITVATAMVIFLLNNTTYGATEVPPEVAQRETGAGWYLTNSNGSTLYTYDSDITDPGHSTCVAKCAVTWPPLLAGPKPPPPGDWAVIVRDDGQRQWAYRGKPLYRSARDSYPGAIFGDGEDGLWHVAFEKIPTPPQITVINVAPLGRILADLSGLALYARESETGRADRISCHAECLQKWKPVAAPWLARPHGEWSIVERGDGARQWAYKGKALYTSILDVNAGEVRGDNIDGWRTVILEPAPKLPAWATIQNSDMGAVIANAQGQTVYAFSGDINKVKLITCNSECIEQHWRPLTAAKTDQPTGNWAVIINEDGASQWTFKGDRLFTFRDDRQPGDIVGDKFAHGHGKFPYAGGWWRPILQACLCIPPASQ